MSVRLIIGEETAEYLPWTDFCPVLWLSPDPLLPPHSPPGRGWDWGSRKRRTTLLAHILPALEYYRHKLTFFEGYITQDIDSAEVFHGIDNFCRFFALKDFLSYGPWKIEGQIRPLLWGLGLRHGWLWGLLFQPAQMGPLRPSGAGLAWDCIVTAG